MGNKITIGSLQWGIIVLTIATAVIHFSLLLPLFILNGLGYLTLLAALYLPIPVLANYRNWVRWALMGFTALTIILWVIMGARSPLGFIDKALEVVLIVLLFIESRQAKE